jgi:exodeoxyribonuclease V beta subunit
MTRIVEDFWRRQLFDAPRLIANQVIANKLCPDKLQREIQSMLGKPYLAVSGASSIEELAGAEPAFLEAFDAARGLWSGGREEVAERLQQSDALNGNRYRKNSIPRWLHSMDEYLGQEEIFKPKPFDKFYKFTTAELNDSTKGGRQAPEHPFFHACDRLHQAAGRLQTYFERYFQILRYRLFSYCNEELPKRKRRQQVQSYDDLLLNLRHGLRTEAQGSELAQSIRERYRAALVDEFQDTDPVQYDIFQSVYHGSNQPVFLVGDPKQAVYSFRGADIFAYLRAKRDAGEELTLATNWRSDPGLVEALNALFSDNPAPFLLDRIPFHPVAPADREHPRLVATDDGDAPFRVWFIGCGENGKVRNKGEAHELSARATAGRIARLLNRAEQGKAYLERDGRRTPLSGGDIAVLVRSHRQAGLVRRALLAFGVPSVQQSRDSVFVTPEAVELERVLLAIASPRREDGVRAALLTDIFGLSGADLEALLGDERAWEAVLLEYSDYHQLWREQGFIRMFRALLVRREVYGRLLGFGDGERRMTNLLHLAELLQEAGVNERLGMEGLIHWLAVQRSHPAADEERQQLRLESDADRVQVVTIHKSKGLEYPIVFCPFLWDGKLWSEKEEIVAFHDPQDGDRPVLDLGSADIDRHRLYAAREELAENLRLAYVALTRAKYRCYMVWGAIKDAASSAPAWLLYRPPVVAINADPVQAQQDLIGGLNEPGWRAGVERLAARAGGAVQLSTLVDLDGESYRPASHDERSLAARVFAGQARPGWHFTSFTALQERHGAELPDRDAGFRIDDAVGSEGEPSIFTFPQGARAGTCLHAIFEQLDFTRDGDQLERLVEDTLPKYGFELSWTPIVSAMVRRVLRAPLDACGRLTLGGVAWSQRLTELEFMYRFDALEADSLGRVLAEAGGDWARRLETPDFRPRDAGFMRGFIDLVFTAGEQVFLLDYKSNWLGPTPDHYRLEALERAMTAGGYHLQYLIYTVALHRYLRWRRPDYDYQRDFGGVLYLFLRGMGPDHPGRGVYATRPPEGLITALDRYLGDRENEHV